MAHITTHHSQTDGWLHRFFSGVGSVFDTIARVLTVNAECEARLRRIERLQAKSDEELAEMGLVRDRIVHHVFRDIYYI